MAAPHRMGRRRLLGLAAVAAAAAGCGPVTKGSGAGAAAPQTASPKTVLKAVLDIPASQPLGTLSERNQLYDQILQTFESANPGLRVQVVPYGSTASNVTAILAGAGPDVFADTAPSYAGYVQQGLLLKLDPYFSRDNVDTSIWSSTVVDALRTPSGSFAVNRGLDAYVFAVNLSLLDSLGLAYPSTNWTHTEFAQLARNIAGTVKGKSTHRYGVSFQGGPGGFLGTLGEVTAGFGGGVTGPGRTTQTLSAAGSLAGVEWLCDNLFLPKVGIDGTGSGNLQSGTAGIQEMQQVQLLKDYEAWQQSFKWMLYPPPTYPKGRVGGAAANYWAISAGSKNPEQAWTLLRWMSTQAPYERFLMKAFLFPPALNSLMPEWEKTTEALAPGLANHGLQWFTQSGDNGWGRAEPWFAYANSQAISLDSAVWKQILARGVGVQSGVQQADQQVNALLKASAAEGQQTLAHTEAARTTAAQRLNGMFAAGTPVAAP